MTPWYLDAVESISLAGWENDGKMGCVAAIAISPSTEVTGGVRGTRRGCEFIDFLLSRPQSVGCVKRTMHYGLWCVSRTLQKFTSSERPGRAFPRGPWERGDRDGSTTAVPTATGTVGTRMFDNFQTSGPNRWPGRMWWPRRNSSMVIAPFSGGLDARWYDAACAGGDLQTVSGRAAERRLARRENGSRTVRRPTRGQGSSRSGGPSGECQKV